MKSNIIFFLDENLLVLFHWLRWQIVSIVFWNCESLLKKNREKIVNIFREITIFFVKSLPLFDTELLVLFGRNRLSPLAVHTLALVPQYLAICQSKSHAPEKKNRKKSVKIEKKNSIFSFFLFYLFKTFNCEIFLQNLSIELF